MKNKLVLLDPTDLHVVKDYKNILQASKKMNVRRQRIYIALETGQLCRGFRWMRHSVWEKTQQTKDN